MAEAAYVISVSYFELRWHSAVRCCGTEMAYGTNRRSGVKRTSNSTEVGCDLGSLLCASCDLGRSLLCAGCDLGSFMLCAGCDLGSFLLAG
eukprot:1052847-Rhodomonas_salina.1